MTKIFDNIDINILDSNELGLYWHYKIIKDGKIFITGWYRFDAINKWYGNNEYIIHCYSPNSMKKVIKNARNKCAIVIRENDKFIVGVTKKCVDFIKEEIRKLYLT